MSEAERTVRGIAASPGIALGFAHVLDQGKLTIPHRTLPRKEVEGEVARFDETLRSVKEQLRYLRKRVNDEQGEEHVYLVDAQVLMLEDKSLTDDTRELIRSQQINVEWALQKALERFKTSFDKIDDEYFRDRRSDIDYVEERLLRALLGTKEHRYLSIQQQTVLIAADLTPSDLTKINRENLVAILTDVGGRTSHTAIIARSLEIPFVTGFGDLSVQVQNGGRVIVDGNEGTAVVHPATKTWSAYQEKKQRYIATRKELLKNRHHKAETKDQFSVHLKANIDLLEELPSMVENGAEGIGMLRTEHLFLGGSVPVSEDEQFEKYKEAVLKAKPHEAVIRLLDLPGDELFYPPSSGPSLHKNPALGLRGVRFLLHEKEIFSVQVRAILRASAFGKAAVLYPMVSTVGEVRLANQWLAEIMQDLKARNIPFDPDLRIGAMIEVPSAALCAEKLAQEVDFFSIGTNDLVQYAMGVDRSNELVADLYDPFHSAVIQLLRSIIEKGHKAGIEVGVCGEVACEPLYVPLLVAMECNFLSMNTAAIPFIKEIVRELTIGEAKQWLAEVADLDRPADVRRQISDRLSGRLRTLAS
ncbi:MAG TPA: phosphoenolpyruvate--protein phosphotransferase [Bdellovibrionota bacterium]|nr:phosphoenolpyruvate--protein phosphotransferase [Bdellovibrionota bacterium]